MVNIGPTVILLLYLNSRILNLCGTAKSPLKDYTFSSLLMERRSQMTKFWTMRSEQRCCVALTFFLERREWPFSLCFFLLPRQRI